MNKKRRVKPADDKRTDQMSELSMVEKKTHVNNLLKRRLRSVLFSFSANFY